MIAKKLGDRDHWKKNVNIYLIVTLVGEYCSGRRNKVVQNLSDENRR